MKGLVVMKVVMKNIFFIQAILAVLLIGSSSQINGMEEPKECPVKPAPRHILPHSTPSPTRTPPHPTPSPSPIRIETLPEEPPTPRTQKKQETKKETEDQARLERLNAVLKDLNAELKKLQSKEKKLLDKMQKQIKKQGKAVEKDVVKKGTKIEKLKRRYADMMLNIKKVKENMEAIETLIANIRNPPVEPKTATFEVLEEEAAEQD
ncbi:MAG: peptidase [candidate division TM6 bacterium GW2011_GWF2_36_6]|jgi:hypothetical protein|nr:MAG: peptidase [candidate division TM6 bacterium GW2011_GWF2_36_6]